MPRELGLRVSTHNRYPTEGPDRSRRPRRNLGIADRLDVFEIEQFVALNLYELGKFNATGRRTAVEEMIERYNTIIDEIETDPSLKITMHN